MLGQALVAVVKLDARIDHLLLAEEGQVVGTKCIRVTGQKRINSSESSHIGLDIGDESPVRFRLARSWVTCPMAREHLSKSQVTALRVSADISDGTLKNGLYCPQ